MSSELGDLIAPRLGGRIGSHARHSGLWFSPAPWVILIAGAVWMIAVARQYNCAPKPGVAQVDVIKAMCHSDFPVIFVTDGFFSGGAPFQNIQPDQPPLAVLASMIARSLTWFFAGRPGAGAGVDVQVHLANIFFAIAAAMLFCCFIALVGAQLHLGHDSASKTRKNRRNPSWDALLVASSPLIVMSGLISWDLLAVALVAVSLYFWSKANLLASGAFLGLALAVRPYPLFIAAGIAVLCWRAGKLKQLAKWAGAMLLFAAVLHLPVMVTAWHSWVESWSVSSRLGSIFYGLELVGIEVLNQSFWSALLILVATVSVAVLIVGAGRRPRLGQISYLMVVPVAIFGLNYSPQQSLWLLPLVVLATPKLSDVAIFSLGEICYWAACWGHLSGALSLTGNLSAGLYPLAILLRIAAQLWISYRCVFDITAPWQDDVRRGLVDDPIGGVLDHSVDTIGIRRLALLRTQKGEQGKPPEDSDGEVPHQVLVKEE